MPLYKDWNDFDTLRDKSKVLEEMKKLLPEYGCDVVEIPRLEKDSGAVSASRVRKFLKEGNFEDVRKIVPAATFRYLRKKYFSIF